jgi:hypothetical protein
MNDEIMDKILEVIIFASALSEQNFKKDIADAKEKAAAVKEIVTDNMETIKSIKDVFMIVSKITLLIISIYLLVINEKFNFNTDTIAYCSSLIIFIYAFIANIIFQENDANKIGIGILSGSLLFVGLVFRLLLMYKDIIIAYFKKEAKEEEDEQTVEQKTELKSKWHRYYLNTLLILAALNTAFTVSDTNPLVIVILTIIRCVVMSLYLVYLKRNGKIRFDKTGIDSTATLTVSTLISYVMKVWDYFDTNNTFDKTRKYSLASTVLLLFLFFLYGVYTDRKIKKLQTK